MTSISSRPSARTPFALDEIKFDIDWRQHDERIWVPLGSDVYSCPLIFNVSEGYWSHLLKVRRPGRINRHYHPGPVHIMTLAGKWYYAERDWVATAGTYVFEAPGDCHTLLVPDDGTEMVFLSMVKGALLYRSDDDSDESYDDVFTRIDSAKRHYIAQGLGPDHVRRFIR